MVAAFRTEVELGADAWQGGATGGHVRLPGAAPRGRGCVLDRYKGFCTVLGIADQSKEPVAVPDAIAGSVRVGTGAAVLCHRRAGLSRLLCESPFRNQEG
ncbi:hypothetical protein GCM10010271_03860 [Streptomyces kurssanovii]|nr:hypothetical protein GCM10010271_03860 [Streptomyces kurssanovii]